MNEENINLSVGQVVYLRSDTKMKHPLTIKEVEEDEDINDWNISCIGITSNGKAEHFRFNSPNMLMKPKKKKKKKKKKISFFPDPIKKALPNKVMD